MRLIAAADRHWAIGSQGKLLVSIPQDQKRFRDETIGGAIIMGRKTFESLPGKQPLYGRMNVILTNNKDYKVKNAVVCHSVEEALSAVKEIPDERVSVIGGESIYRQFLPYCTEADVTWIDFTYAADTFLPKLEEKDGWKLISESDEQTYFDICYTYRLYRRENL